jgi:hypothetical protein
VGDKTKIATETEQRLFCNSNLVELYKKNCIQRSSKKRKREKKEQKLGNSRAVAKALTMESLTKTKRLQRKKPFNKFKKNANLKNYVKYKK